MSRQFWVTFGISCRVCIHSFCCILFLLNCSLTSFWEIMFEFPKFSGFIREFGLHWTEWVQPAFSSSPAEGDTPSPLTHTAPICSAHKLGSTSTWQEPGLLTTCWGFGFRTTWGCIHTWQELAFLRTHWEVPPWEGKVRKKEKIFVCADCWVGLGGSVSRRPSRGTACWGKLWGLVSFVCGADCVQCPLTCDVQFSRHHRLRGLSFSSLFLWPVYLFLCHFYTVWGL